MTAVKIHMAICAPETVSAFSGSIFTPFSRSSRSSSSLFSAHTGSSK